MRGFVGRSATADAGGARRGEVGRHERLAARVSVGTIAIVGAPRSALYCRAPSLSSHRNSSMPPSSNKRKVSAVWEDDDDAPARPQRNSPGDMPPPPPAAVIDGDAAEKIANKICRYVLLREHTRKPIPRKEIKDNTMSEQNDRSGKVFRQCLGVANDKLKELAGLELVALDAPPVEDDDGGAGGTQAVASQAAAGASQAAAMAKPQAAYILVNRLPEPYQTELDEMPAMYQAFIEVILSFIQQSDGELTEERLFGYPNWPRAGQVPPQPAEQTIRSASSCRSGWSTRRGCGAQRGGGAERRTCRAGARAVLSRVDRADEPQHPRRGVTGRRREMRCWRD